jgi:N-acetylneuraminic acid mutarotase
VAFNNKPGPGLFDGFGSGGFTKYQKPWYQRLGGVQNVATLAGALGGGTLPVLPWAEVGSNTLPITRDGHTSVVSNNKMWIIGGEDSAYNLSQKVYSSPDGTTWTEVGSNALPIQLYYHSSVVANNKMWVMGGQSNTAVIQRKVYSSADGITWAESGSNALPFALSSHSSLFSNNKMWVIGGINATSSLVRTVYSSADGITWAEVGSNALPIATAAHSSLVYNGLMWVIGGYNTTYSQKVFYSSDGITWNEAGSNALPVALEYNTSLVFNGLMWVIGGENASVSRKVYSSSDGITWTESGTNALPVGSYDHTSVVFNNKMWVIGGDDATATAVQKVYSTPGGTAGGGPAGSIIRLAAQLNKTNNLTARSGLIVKAATHTLAGALTVASTLLKISAKLVVNGLVAFAGAPILARTVNRIFTGAMLCVGAISRIGQFLKIGTLTASGTVAKQDQKPLAGAHTPSGAPAKQPRKPLSGTVTESGTATFIATLKRTLTGALTASGVPTFVAAMKRILTGAVIDSGAVLKQPRKPLSGTLTESGALTFISTLRRTLAGALTARGTVAFIAAMKRILIGAVIESGNVLKQDQKPLSGAQTPHGVPAKQDQKPLVGSLTESGVVAKQPQKPLSGTLTESGVITYLKSLMRTLTAALTAAGVLTNKQDQKSLVGTLINHGVPAKSLTKPLSGTPTFTGALRNVLATKLAGLVTLLGVGLKQAHKPFAAGLTGHGALTSVRTLLRTLTGALASSIGALVRLPQLVKSSTQTPSGTLTNAVRTKLAGLVTLSGSFLKTFLRAVAGSMLSHGAIQKIAQRASIGVMSFASTISRIANKTLTAFIYPTDIISLIAHHLTGAVTITLNGLLTAFGVPNNTIMKVEDAGIPIAASIAPWTLRTPPVSSMTTVGDLGWQGIAWSPTLNLFAAVGFSYESNTDHMASSTDGISWTIRNAPTGDNYHNSLKWIPELAKFIGTIGNFRTANNISFSSDGINWTSSGMAGDGYHAIAYAPTLGMLLAVGDTADIISSIDGGTTWVNHQNDAINTTALDPMYPGVLSDIIWATGKFVIVGIGGTPSTSNTVMTTTDGVHYSLISAFPGRWTSIAYSAPLGMFAAVNGQLATGPYQIMTSPDASNGSWTGYTTPINSDSGQIDRWNKIIWIDALHMFLAVSQNDTIVTSTDGVTWTYGVRLIPQASYGSYSAGAIAFSPALNRIAGAGATNLGAPHFFSADVTPGVLGILRGGVITNTVALVKSATLTTLGTLTRNIRVLKTAILGAIGTGLKFIRRPVVGTQTSTGTLTLRRILGMALSGTLHAFGSIARFMGLKKTAVVTPIGAPLKQTSRATSGTARGTGSLSRTTHLFKFASVTITGTLAMFRMLSLVLSAALTMVGSPVRQAQKFLRAAALPGATLSKQTQHGEIGRLTPMSHRQKFIRALRIGTQTAFGRLFGRRYRLRRLVVESPAAKSPTILIPISRTTLIENFGTTTSDRPLCS